MQEIYISIAIIGGVLVAIIGQILSFLYVRKKRKLQDNLIKNAAELVHRIDKLEYKILKQGEKNMDKDVKKLAMYFKQQLADAKEEIIDKIDELIENMEKEETDEGEEEPEEEKDEFEELDEYEGDRKISFDDAMEEIETEKKDKKKKKK
jgi:biopolymer transport protein ExbB/TolQ